MNKIKTPFLAILLLALLSACSGDPASQPSASATPEVDTAAQVRATLRAALPTATGASDLATAQPAATLPPVFDLTRTEDNPITDAQQIIEILAALDGIQQAQPISPGWYLMRTVNPPETFYQAFHVLDSQGNFDIYTMFLLSPERPISGVVEKMDDETIYVTLDTRSFQNERYEGCCNLNDPNKDYFERFSENFSDRRARWEQPSGAQWGEWTYAGWFERDAAGYIFVVKEEITNMKGASSPDPDTQVMTAREMETQLRGISLITGHQVWETKDITLVNGRKVQIIYILERDYCLDVDCFPIEALDFLQEYQVIENALPSGD